ncbi:MAG: nucleotide exchange factor GrpE [Nitrospinaceae bacterium]
MSKKKKPPLVENEVISNEVEVDSSIPTEESEVTVEEPIILEPIEALEKELQETKDELDEQKDKFIRLQAETDNFRKRLSREKEEFSQYANERLFKGLIPIFDNFERALEDPSNEIKSLKEGLDMTLKQFSTFLEKENVEPIKAIGEKFNPELHEALTSEESNDHEEDTIISQFVKGYKINNRVLRPSQVIIAKKPTVAVEDITNEEENAQKEENSTN